MPVPSSPVENLKLCVKLYDIVIVPISKAGACMEVKLKLGKLTVKKIDLGCLPNKGDQLMVSN